jgi:hypothetical protein
VKHSLPLRIAALLLAPGVAVPTAPPPNVILILADDLGYGSLGCYGSTEIRTPNIDRLAAGGMRFTDFHSNGALCSCTRSNTSWMTTPCLPETFTA